MPNYVTNIVSIDGSPEKVTQLLDQIAFDGHPGTFDFNKVVPMPKSLNLTEGSITDDAIDAYLSFAYPGSDSRLSINERISSNEFYSILISASDIRPFYTPDFRLSDQQIAKLAEEHGMRAPEDLVLLGKQYMDNYREYGAATWYGWSIKHWGTKWNNDPETPLVDEKTSELHFDTAWSMPEPIYEELSRQYPNLLLEVRWADEDLGYNVGIRRYKNGERIYEYLPEQGSPEAMKMAFDIKGMSAEDIAMDYPELSDLVEKARDRVQAKQQSPKDKTHELKSHQPER